jgi:hypothetical protein
MATDIRPPPLPPPSKGILKKPSRGPARGGRPARSGSPSAPETPSPSARDIAVRHATIIQQRKELEAAVIESIVTLSEFPLVRECDRSAAHPADIDVAQFKSHIRLFQPSDYDDLVVERNSNNLCGYALCPRPNRKMGSNASWKLVNMGKQNFDILSRDELEKWCSTDCKRRALWIRIQLSETAAWERAGIPDIRIDLFGEDTSTTSIEDAARDLANLQLGEKKKAEAANNALALERGDDASTAVGLVDVVIREKETRKVEYDDADDSDEDHLLTEGYKVRFTTSK